jgi:type IX secretion system PorP/SprF family membrane protein
MKNVIYIIFFICVCNVLQAQQVTNGSLMNNSRVFLNPALTAVDNNRVIDAYFRMQWLGFKGAPVTGFASFQQPFVKQNMSAGAMVHTDGVGPINRVGLKLNYAYKLKQVLGRSDQFSFGLSADFQQYAFNPNSQIVNDVNEPYLGAKQSSFFPSLGVGAYYMSSTRAYRENMFFAGLALNQVFTTDVLVNNVDQDREQHFHLNFGGRFYQTDSYIEPMIVGNLVKPDQINMLYGLRYEKEETFWAGLGYESSGFIGIQGGVILTNMGSDGDGIMRLGVLANYGMLNKVDNLGSSIEMSIGYYLSQK